MRSTLWLALTLVACAPSAPSAAQGQAARPADAPPSASPSAEGTPIARATSGGSGVVSEGTKATDATNATGDDPAAATALAEPSPQVVAGPGFVLYTARRTIVVPVAAGAPTIEGVGLWFLDERPGGRVRLIVGDALDELPECGAGQRACPSADAVDVVGDAPPCECRPRAEPEPEIDADDEDHCDESWLSPTSIVGDRLHWLGAHHSVCGGFNRYDAIDQEIAVFDAAALSASGLGPVTCDPENGPGDPSPIGRLTALPCVRVAEGWAHAGDRAADPECFSCGDLDPEAELWLLRRGRLYRIEDNVFHAGGARWVASVAATPTRCPSPADPCGDPRRFRALAGEAEFWVDNAGGYALIVDDQGISIARAGAAAAERRDAGPSGALLGARHHADVGPLVRAMIGGAIDRRATGDATACGPGGCAAHEGHAGVCDPGRPCPGDAACEDGRCRVHAALADDDRPLLAGGSRALGDRCVLHLRAGRLAAATAACDAALARATDDRARGAILFNLGRIAETIGDHDAAAATYRRSLSLRPNAVVEAALARVVGGG